MTQLIPEGTETEELLAAGTVLHRRYVIDGVLGRGAYGATYYGHDEKAGIRIAVKEFFPSALAERASKECALSPKNKSCGPLFFLGGEMFYRQHLALTDVKGSDNLASVYAVFFENGTSYAVMELLEGVTLGRFLQLHKRRLFADEAMFIAASLADALLVLHSLNTLHYDISPRSIFLCTDGKTKLIDFGAAKAALRARRAVDDAEPWIDLAAMARTLNEAMTGQAAFGGDIQPHANTPPQLFDLFRRMIDTDERRRITSVFDYRHALACVELNAVYPDVSLEDVRSQIPEIRKPAAENRPRETAAKPAAEDGSKRSTLFQRALDAMEGAVTNQNRSTGKAAQKEQQIKRKAGVIYLGVVAVVLVLALLLRGLIH